MAQLYADEQFPLPVVKILRNLGHDILTVQEAGKADQKIPDYDVLQFAISLNRAVLTMNRRDFIQLHHKYPEQAGIIEITKIPSLKLNTDIDTPCEIVLELIDSSLWRIHAKDRKILQRLQQEFSNIREIEPLPVG